MSSIAVTQCPRFIQNAWKKDLCSNCFKSKEEHAAIMQTIKSVPTTSKRVLNAPSKSIIKTALPSSKKHKKKSVNFPSEVSKVSYNFAQIIIIVTVKINRLLMYVYCFKKNH